MGKIDVKGLWVADGSIKRSHTVAGSCLSSIKAHKLMISAVYGTSSVC